MHRVYMHASGVRAGIHACIYTYVYTCICTYVYTYLSHSLFIFIHAQAHTAHTIHTRYPVPLKTGTWTNTAAP